MSKLIPHCFLAVVVLSTLIGCMVTRQSHADGKWDLRWNDEFDGQQLDSNSWNVEIGNGPASLPEWGNEELQYYTNRSRNVRLEEGKLVLEAHQEMYGGCSYTSSRIQTHDKVDFTYGKVVVKAKLPCGKGIWPAVWLLPSDSALIRDWAIGGEIDLMEYKGNEPHTVHGTLHYGGKWPQNQQISASYSQRHRRFDKYFNTFTLEWEPNSIKWYVGKKLILVCQPKTLFPEKWVFDQHFHIIINLAVGGRWPGNPDSATKFPQEMQVKYIRLYALADSYKW